MLPKGQWPWELVEGVSQTKFEHINVKVTQKRLYDDSVLP